MRKLEAELKIVLLPGLDGTGKLFAPLLPAIAEHEVQTIPLPSQGRQDYESLSLYVNNRLPAEDHILVAESYSGPIAAMLASKGLSKIRGVIFVASFLSPPRRPLLAISKVVPVKLLTQIPFTNGAIRYFCLGKDASGELIELFKETIRDVNAVLIRERIKLIETLNERFARCETPALYLMATHDRLVPSSKSEEFFKTFEQIKVLSIDGPHFLLQANPEECAKSITEFIEDLGKRN